jgi:predicted RNA binding protein YcfA (HicA-like mRNA interferase family)
MKGHNEKAENKYRDQANDAATVRYFRKKSGTPDWYKKKYDLVKEETELNESVNEKQIKKDLDSGMSHDAVIGKHSNKKFTNTNEIRKVIQKHAWDKRMKKEEVEINERSLTSSEEEKVEDIVKGMKKNKSDFKERYGKRAREVMYATATKLAQNEEVFHEDSIGAKVTRQWNRLTKPLDQAKKDIDSPGMKRWERDQRLSVGRGTPEDVASRDKEAVDTLDKTRKDIHKNYATKESYSSEDGILDEMTISGFRTTRDLTKHLKKNGWSLGRTTGGHDVFVHATNKNNIAVPRHKGDIPPGTVRNIIKTAGLHNEDVDLSESRKADIVKDAWKTAKAKNLKNSDNQTNVESESDQRKDIFQKDPEMGGKIVKQ